jgi:hypothetical protein
MAIPDKYDGAKSLKEKILYVLSKLEKGSADEVAMEVMELDGISTEDGVGDITKDINDELHKMLEEGEVERIKKDHREKVRYVRTR